jgi:hypothetical protein
MDSYEENLSTKLRIILVIPECAHVEEWEKNIDLWGQMNYVSF